MPHLYLHHEWRSLMTAIALAGDTDDAPRLAAADLLHAQGEPLRAAYIRACCRHAAGVAETVADTVLPAGFATALLSGWVPRGELLCYWERGFVARIHGPLDVIRGELPWLMLREPLYQTPDGPVIVSVSDHWPFRIEDPDHDDRWTWENVVADAEQTADGGGPLLPDDLFELLPWPPVFDAESTAAAALSTALLSEAHDAITTAHENAEPAEQQSSWN
jgi:uncharacterized protein (TIGR02996 family)